MRQLRKTEIHGRRTRRAKLATLRQRYLNSTSEKEKETIFDKVQRRVPGLSREEFLLTKTQEK